MKSIMGVCVSCSVVSLCDLKDCSQQGSSVRGILQARILEWVVRFFSSVTSWDRDQTWASHSAGRLFTIWATGEAHPKISEDFSGLYIIYNL